MAAARRAALLAGCTALFLSCCGGDSLPAGVAVRSLDPSGAAARAGLRTGDRLLAFHRGAAPPANRRATEGPLLRCAQVAELEVEEAPRGPVELTVERHRERLHVTLPAGEWKVEVAPPPGGRFADPGCADLAAARRLAGDQKLEEALAAYERAARWAESARRPLFLALVRDEAGALSTIRNDFPRAERALAESLRLRRQSAPGSLAEAAAWHALGKLERARAAYDRADLYFHKALELRARLAPDSLERAFTLNNLGIDAWARGDLERAGAIYHSALVLVRRRAPDSPQEAQVLNNLGLLSRLQGELAQAEAYFKAAYHINLAQDPRGLDVARNLANLGVLAHDRGNFALSESYHRQAIERFQQVAPDGLEVANGLYNLGLIAAFRQDNAGAEALMRRSLAIRQRLAAGTLFEAASLSVLANIELATGRLDEAERLGRQAYALRSRLAPAGEDAAISLGILAKIALARKQYARAEEMARRELASHEAHGGSGLSRVHSLMLLAEIASAQGHDSEARGDYRAALDLERRYLPDALLNSECLDQLGQIESRRGHRRAAEALFKEALDNLEGQLGRLGGTDEERSSFESSYLPMYQDLIDLQVTRGEPAAAVATLERSRARGLLALLSQRDLVFSADLSPALLDRQRRIDRAYEAAQREIARLAPQERAEIEARRGELVRLRGERAVLAAEIARTAPRYAALRDPKPLDLAGIQKALDPGTVWLSYSVGPGASYLFVVTPREEKVFPLATRRDSLESEVTIFRSLLLRGAGGASGAAPESALLSQGRRLYQLLLAPAEPWVAAAERVLISADGPLHNLPFAALVRPGPTPSFLVDWKPLHTVVSATLYAELRARRRSRTEAASLVAFADPSYPPVRGVAGPDDSPLRRYSLGLQPLPASRGEARALAALYGPQAHLYLGRAARERQAVRLPADARIVHFAGHALLDRRFPLDSALAFSAPGSNDPEEDGLLQAWEIFERLRLDADLVTLSACETGLGAAGGGEGLIGLARAFQYAGARSILASLWSVSDRSTAELMKRFYAALRAGSPKDEALQAAQRALLHDPKLGYGHPYHWATFELIGDWQ
jgi:CHAT domain-containing protein/Tfp pilus assembly protein PilF